MTTLELAILQTTVKCRNNKNTGPGHWTVWLEWSRHCQSGCSQDQDESQWGLRESDLGRSRDDDMERFYSSDTTNIYTALYCPLSGRVRESFQEMTAPEVHWFWLEAREYWSWNSMRSKSNPGSVLWPATLSEAGLGLFLYFILFSGKWKSMTDLSRPGGQGQCQWWYSLDHLACRGRLRVDDDQPESLPGGARLREGQVRDLLDFLNNSNQRS